MYVNTFFSMSAEYLAKLSRLTPKFGYQGFGEIVFYRTYSRLKADGGQENWHDVVVRVINGTMSIRKDWYQRNYVHWDEEYWQNYAYQMAVSLFKMYWMPAGRGLWAMGTVFVYERGSMALNNCFSGSTKFVANQGIHTLKELVGQSVDVLTNNGQKKAEVGSFGEQHIYNVVLKPHRGKSNYRLNYEVTRNHRWILADGRETTRLQQGDLIEIKPNHVTSDSPDYNDGFIHGLIFADGCNHYKNTYYIQLCDWKEKYRKLIEQSKLYSHTIDTEQRIILQSPDVALKALPGNDENIYYKQGFVDAWRMMDGHWKKDTYCLDSTHPDAFQWLSEHSGFLNYVVVGHSIENAPTNYGARNAPLHRVKMKFEPVKFIVDQINYTFKKEEVFCVVEPVTHTFMLAGGVVTGNCGFTKLGGNSRLSDDLHWLMDALMLGVGVGFEPIRDDLKIYKPVGEFLHYVGDSREDWCGSWRMLIDAYTKPGLRKPKFKFDRVRRKGLPIRGFGGLASGPEPLKQLFEETEQLFETPKIDIVRLKTDLANKCGVCVVAGNVRRSAELSKGQVTDKVFLDLKDYDLHPDREDWGWMSNNTVALIEDEDFELLGEVAKRVVIRGEPGVMNLRNFKYGRVGKPIPVREDMADGLNPCGEIPLEDKELCNVVETLPTVCETIEDWYKACEYASFYASCVSLLPTHREETNRVVVRNRRIGVSIIDWTGWVQSQGLHKVTSYMRKGYDVVTETNKVRNAEAGVPEAIRKTTIKPGGTTPKLPGKTPGIGYPTFRETLRRLRVAANNPICPVLDDAGIPFTPDFWDQEGTRVYEYPTLQGPTPPADEISLWEQAFNLVTVQREWADNAVSNTLYFRPKWRLELMRDTFIRPPSDNDMNSYAVYARKERERQFREDFPKYVQEVLADWRLPNIENDFVEVDRICAESAEWKFKTKLNKFGEWELYVWIYDPNHEENVIEKVCSAITPLTKSYSLLPHSAKGAYRQMPEEGISSDEYESRLDSISRIDWSMFGNSDGMDTKYCDGDVCALPGSGG